MSSHFLYKTFSTLVDMDVFGYSSFFLTKIIIFAYIKCYLSLEHSTVSTRCHSVCITIEPDFAKHLSECLYTHYPMYFLGEFPGKFTGKTPGCLFGTQYISQREI